MADGRSSSKGRGGSIHWGRGILLLLSMILAITVLMVAVAGCGGGEHHDDRGGWCRHRKWNEPNG